jgi:hypothetical protein
VKYIAEDLYRMGPTLNFVKAVNTFTNMVDIIISRSQNLFINEMYIITDAFFPDISLIADAHDVVVA